MGLTLNQNKGDSTFEIQACTSREAMTAIENNKTVINYFKEMAKFQDLKMKISESDRISKSELHYYMNQIADRSIRIEEIFKSKRVSYTVLHHIKSETAKFRSSKNQLQNSLRQYFEQEFSIDSTENSNVLTIRTIDSKIEFKYLVFESILNTEAILTILKKLKNISPLLIIFNKYRNIYYLYSKDSIKDNQHIDDYFNYVYHEILKKNPNTKLVESTDNYRILKTNKNHSPEMPQNYFTF